jgi:hypothetical protein
MLLLSPWILRKIFEKRGIAAIGICLKTLRDGRLQCQTAEEETYRGMRDHLPAFLGLLTEQSFGLVSMIGTV